MIIDLCTQTYSRAQWLDGKPEFNPQWRRNLFCLRNVPNHMKFFVLAELWVVINIWI